MARLCFRVWSRDIPVPIELPYERTEISWFSVGDWQVHQRMNRQFKKCCWYDFANIQTMRNTHRSQGSVNWINESWSFVDPPPTRQLTGAKIHPRLKPSNVTKAVHQRKGCNVPASDLVLVGLSRNAASFETPKPLVSTRMVRFQMPYYPS